MTTKSRTSIVRLPFTKMHGLGNDFVMLSSTQMAGLDLDPDTQADRLKELAIFLCDRHFGIGADGLILPAAPKDSNNADIRFVYYNSDGSCAEMCGNGIRCFALYVKDLGLVKGDAFTVDTPAGLIRPKINPANAHGERTVTVDMGAPILASGKVPFRTEGQNPAETALRFPIDVKGTSIPVTAVSMGNPHCLIFQDELNTRLDPAEFGSLIENHASFPQKTNVEFIDVIDSSHLNVTVWERGCGFTLACGTGACATAVAARLLGKVGDTTDVMLPGGSLTIEWSGQSDAPVLMSGPATYVFEGEIDIPQSVLWLETSRRR